MRIAIGCDHAGFNLKESMKNYLVEKGYEIEDMGTDGPESVDYPDFVHPVCVAVSDGAAEYGILICGTGNGVSMTANKYPKIRCGLSWDPEVAALIRQHNNANIVAIPARFVDLNIALKIVENFFNYDFEGGRHERRVNKMTPELSFC